MTDSEVIYMEDTPDQEDWRVAHARIEEKLRRNAKIQQQWNSSRPTTLVDAAKSLCDRNAPPPTPEELVWLRDNLIEHQQTVGKLIELIEFLLQSAISTSESKSSQSSD